MIRLHNGPPPEVTVEVHPATLEELAEYRDFVARNRHLHLELRPELLAKYPDKYVALTRNWTLVVADSTAELIEKMDAMGELGGAVRDFLNTKPRRRVVIL